MSLKIFDVQIVKAVEFKDWTGAAASGDYVSLKNFNTCGVLITTNAFAGGTAAVTLQQATAVAGTGAKALAFTTYYTKADTAGTWTEATATSNTFNLAAANTQYFIQIDAEDLDRDNDFDVVNVEIASPGVNADVYGAHYIMDAMLKPAYNQSAIVD